MRRGFGFRLSVLHLFSLSLRTGCESKVIFIDTLPRYKSLARFSICLLRLDMCYALDMLPFGNEIYIISKFCLRNYIEFVVRQIYRVDARHQHIDKKRTAAILFCCSSFYYEFFKNSFSISKISSSQ